MLRQPLFKRKGKEEIKTSTDQGRAHQTPPSPSHPSGQACREVLLLFVHLFAFLIVPLKEQKVRGYWTSFTHDFSNIQSQSSDFFLKCRNVDSLTREVNSKSSVTAFLRHR